MAERKGALIRGAIPGFRENFGPPERAAIIELKSQTDVAILSLKRFFINP